MNKSSVLVGSDVATGLPLHRRFLYFRASRAEEIIQVFYDEFLLVNGNEIEKKNEKFYIVKDIAAIPASGEVEEIPAFLGFTNWFNFDVGSLPNGTKLGDVLVSSINAQLQALPLVVETGHVVNE